MFSKIALTWRLSMGGEKKFHEQVEAAAKRARGRPPADRTTRRAT